jgi:hypothetical protein
MDEIFFCGCAKCKERQDKTTAKRKAERTRFQMGWREGDFQFRSKDCSALVSPHLLIYLAYLRLFLLKYVSENGDSGAITEAGRCL